MSRGARLTLSVVAWVVILLGSQYVLSAIIDGYMVTAGGVTPGEPMGMDTLSYPLRDAALDGVFGLGVITLGVTLRFYVSRKGRVAS